MLNRTSICVPYQCDMGIKLEAVLLEVITQKSLKPIQKILSEGNLAIIVHVKSIYGAHVQGSSQGCQKLGTNIGVSPFGSAATSQSSDKVPGSVFSVT